MKIETTDTNVLKATKGGATNVIAWIDPQGQKCTAVDGAIANFNSIHITITEQDKKMMNKAIRTLTSNNTQN